MKIEHADIAGLIIVTLDIFEDERGFFVERFNAQKFSELGLPVNFVQDNHSLSKPNVLRGLHSQQNPAQGKLVGAISGTIFDVAVDIRPNSKTFGKYFAIELSAQNGKLLWIPEGFAHGFCVLGDTPANVMYKTTALYNKQGETGIIWNDKNIGIKWPIDNPVVSARDQELPSLTSSDSSGIL